MKTLISILLCSITFSAFSQTTSKYDNILLNSAATYRKAEPEVILAADYVYSTPIDKDNTARKNAVSFIMKWMAGTSDYSFGMDETIKKIAGNDNDLLGMYFVCLAKYALSKGINVDRETLKYNAYVVLVNFCENPENNCKQSREVKKMIEAKNQNTLQEYLDSKQKK